MLAGAQAYLTGISKLNLFSVTRVAINGGLAGFGIVTIQSPIPGLMALGALTPPGKTASPRVGDNVEAGATAYPDGLVASVNAGMSADALDDNDIDDTSVATFTETSQSIISATLERFAVDEEQNTSTVSINEENTSVQSDRNASYDTEFRRIEWQEFATQYILPAY